MAHDDVISVPDSDDGDVREATIARMRRVRTSFEKQLDTLPPDGECAASVRRILNLMNREISRLVGDTSQQARLKYMREYMRKRRREKK